MPADQFPKEDLSQPQSPKATPQTLEDWQMNLDHASDKRVIGFLLAEDP
jgi:hypothetical protein